MAEWLDHLTLVQRVPGSKPPSDLSQKCEEKISQLSVIPGTKAKGGVVTLSGRTRVALLD